MQKLAEICVRRPVFASVLILALVVIGAFSYVKLGVDRFPNVEFPFVTVTTVLPGAAPEEIETEVSDKIEEAVNTISGIDELSSFSSENVSVVRIAFDLDKNGDVAAQEVRDRVSAILSDLPLDAEPPIVQKLDPDAIPVVQIAISGTGTPRDVSEYADKVFRRRIETVAGVGQVLVIGARPRQINVVVDTAKLAAQGLTAAQVVSALQSQNVQIPGGRVEQGLRELTLRTYGRVTDPEEFGSIPIANRGDTVIRIRDVARIDDGVADVETLGSVSGHPAVVLVVRKQSGTNTIETVERIKERVDVLRKDLPAGWTVQVVQDQSDYIIAAVDAVKEHLILGSIFAALIVWFFLSGPAILEAIGMIVATLSMYALLFKAPHAHWGGIPSLVFVAAGGLIGAGMLAYFFRKSRPTIISAVAIPSSLIATFAAMAFMGFTLNIITLLALTLAVGIVIDDAVVVLENIFRHMEEKGMTPMEAAVSGTREVGLAVMATSMSLIAVFLPVSFMGGIVGRFMYSFGVTMAFAIAVSLLVSFTLTPMMASRWLRRGDLNHDKGSKEHGVYAAIEGVYVRMLEWSMKHRWVIVTVMTLVFISTYPLFLVVNKNFLPYDDESQFAVSVRAPEGASVDSTDKIAESIASRIRKLPGVASTVVTIGDDPQKTLNLANLYVKLVPTDQRKQDQFEIMDRVRTEILPLYESLHLRVQVAPVNAFSSGANAEIMFWLGGPDLERLDKYANVLTDAIKDPSLGTADIDTNFIVGKPELAVRIDRDKAADLGVRVQDIAATLNVLVGGSKTTSYYEGGEEYEVHARANASERRDIPGIMQMEVPSSKVGTVRLSDVVTMVEGTGPSIINRLNRRRMVLIMANMKPGHNAQKVMDILSGKAKELNMPSSYSTGFTGRSREQGKAAVNFMLAFILSIVFMYLILAAQFESWVHPVTILISLPLTVPFALLSIVGLNESLNIFSSLGIIVLFGIVKKNAILQVDHTNGLRAKGMERAEAILLANRDRFRPILMTTMAFVAGMTPLVASSGTGAGTNRAIGSVIIGGQTLVLVLTLLATPVMYSIFDDVQEWMRRRRTKHADAGEESTPENVSMPEASPI